LPINQAYDDKELLLRLDADDKWAFDMIYQRYEPKLRLFLSPFTGGDPTLIDNVLQDVFVKLWLKRKELTGIAVLEFYLQRMAKNRLLDLLKLRDIREKHTKAYAALSADEGSNPDAALQLKEYHLIAREGIAKLPERRRVIFTMNVLEGWSVDEIAVQLQVSKEVVKKQLQMAKAFVREYISQHGLCIALLIISFL
jgi:RNA polymerase sigma factor (sigma-70 family)